MPRTFLDDKELRTALRTLGGGKPRRRPGRYRLFNGADEYDAPWC